VFLFLQRYITTGIAQRVEISRDGWNTRHPAKAEVSSLIS
jgi:hypothetical protein